MSTLQIRGQCETCGGPKLFTKQGPSHILHLILSVITIGIWLPIWLLCVILNAFKPFRCEACGKAKVR